MSTDDITYSAGAKARIRHIMGRPLTEDEIAAIVGAQDDDALMVRPSEAMLYPNGLEIILMRPTMMAVRFLNRDASGTPSIHNLVFTVTDEPPGANTALDHFVAQAMGTNAVGVPLILTTTPEPYPWPRIGFTGTVGRFRFDARTGSPSQIRLGAFLRARRELLQMPAGQRLSALPSRAAQSDHGEDPDIDGIYETMAWSILDENAANLADQRRPE